MWRCEVPVPVGMRVSYVLAGVLCSWVFANELKRMKED
jgi:hypothetical protein